MKAVEKQFRPLRESERELIERLLQKNFEGRDELRGQLDLVLARTIDQDGSLAFMVPPEAIRVESHELTGMTPDELLSQGLPVEGRYLDMDGVPVCVMLHVSQGRLHELEILRVDGSPIQRDPLEATLILGSPTSGRVIPPGSLWPRDGE